MNADGLLEMLAYHWAIYSPSWCISHDSKLLVVSGPYHCMWFSAVTSRKINPQHQFTSHHAEIYMYPQRFTRIIDTEHINDALRYPTWNLHASRVTHMYQGKNVYEWWVCPRMRFLYQLNTCNTTPERGRRQRKAILRPSHLHLWPHRMNAWVSSPKWRWILTIASSAFSINFQSCDFDQNVNAQTNQTFNDVEVIPTHLGLKAWAPVLRKKMYHVPTSDEVRRAMVGEIQEVDSESPAQFDVCWRAEAHHIKCEGCEWSGGLCSMRDCEQRGSCVVFMGNSIWFSLSS